MIWYGQLPSMSPHLPRQFPENCLHPLCRQGRPQIRHSQSEQFILSVPGIEPGPMSWLQVICICNACILVRKPV